MYKCKFFLFFYVFICAPRHSTVLFFQPVVVQLLNFWVQYFFFQHLGHGLPLIFRYNMFCVILSFGKILCVGFFLFVSFAVSILQKVAQRVHGDRNNNIYILINTKHLSTPTIIIITSALKQKHNKKDEQWSKLLRLSVLILIFNFFVYQWKYWYQFSKCECVLPFGQQRFCTPK